ncbi:MAG TPA: hypothetical protein VIN56_10190 [Candidatus Dormibacteraeota bacterium]
MTTVTTADGTGGAERLDNRDSRGPLGWVAEIKTDAGNLDVEDRGGPPLKGVPPYPEPTDGLGEPFPLALFEHWRADSRIAAAMDRINRDWQIALASRDRDQLGASLFDEELLIEYITRGESPKGGT